MTERVDVLVVGAGVIGSAIALELARRKREVRVVERGSEGTRVGASGGVSRVFRVTYTDPLYSALARDCYPRWIELEQEAREHLLFRVGSLEFGPATKDLALILSELNVPFDLLPPRSTAQRFSFQLPSDAIFVHQAGVLASERVVETQVRLAKRLGATFEFDVGADAVREDASSLVRVKCGDLAYSANVVVLAPGRWLPELAASLGLDLCLTTRSEHLAYLTAAHSTAPVVIDWRESGRYLVPGVTTGRGAKTAVDSIEVSTPDCMPTARIERTGQALRWIESVTGEPATIDRWERCATIHTHHRDFILDRRGSVVVVSACSGHGFKFAPEVAGVAADLVQSREPRIPKALLRRWSLGSHVA